MSQRYSRQELFAPLGRPGQEKIRAARVGVVGCGALGSVSAELLVRSGIGALRIVDRDFVEESNLQRQSLFTEEHAAQGLPKAIAAHSALEAINSEVEVEAWVQDLGPGNIGRFAQGCDLLIDGSDNFETRFLVNDFSVSRTLPWIYGAALGSYGIGAPFDPRNDTTPCFRCFLGERPQAGTVETCETAGIIGPVIQAVAAFQVANSMRFIVEGSFVDRVLRVDVWSGSWRTTPLPEGAEQDCECCVGRRFPHLSGARHDRLTRLCGREAVQVYPQRETKIDFSRLDRRLRRTAQVKSNPHMMRIEVDRFEIALFPDGRSIIRGTDDPGVARAVYARYIGN